MNNHDVSNNLQLRQIAGDVRSLTMGTAWSLMGSACCLLSDLPVKFSVGTGLLCGGTAILVGIVFDMVSLRRMVYGRVQGRD